MEPGIIKKLDEDVVNRIAAGEIIQRPCNALKELLENSLDAKSNQIQVTVRHGGLKLLQIQDNGTGIRKEDLPILCERFTTSKLNKYEDLLHVNTYGFRGEALASISLIAHLTIQTKTIKEKCAYKAIYDSNKLKGLPKPCAGNQGTIITIEDLFYNMPQRKQAFKSINDEFQRIYDVIAKYAIHNAHNAGFVLKKHGDATICLKTNVNSTPSSNIQIIYGLNISKELINISMKDNVHKFSMTGLITNVNYTNKKGIILLFINHRLVESTAIKNSIDNVYSTYLPKGMHPFVYLSLELDPINVDVNVHPTKHEVHFLYQEEIVEKIQQHIENVLFGSNATRILYKQMKLPSISINGKNENDVDNEKNKEQQLTVNENHRIYAKDMVRTDNKMQKLDKFLLNTTMTTTTATTAAATAAAKETSDKHDSIETLSLSDNISTSQLSDVMNQSFRHVAKRKIKRVKLTSVLQMMQQIETNCCVELRKILKEMVFVGVVNRQFSLFQCETTLYMMNTLKLCEELFYQRLVYEFENLSTIDLMAEKLFVKSLIRLSLTSSESGWTEEDGDKDELTEQAFNILMERRDLIHEYFNLNITNDGVLLSLPCVIKQHKPNKTGIPIYLLRLATEVNWAEEKECFETFCRETALYYARIPAIEYERNIKEFHWKIEHILYPAMKKYLLPPERLKTELYELTNLSQLYKVFERC